VLRQRDETAREAVLAGGERNVGAVSITTKGVGCDGRVNVPNCACTFHASEEPKLSISGYDPVAYFTDGKPVQGKTEFEYL
jgi:hypothetical protein